MTMPERDRKAVERANRSLRCVAYVRVSSRAQDDGSQLHAIRQAAKARGDELGHVYREKLSAKTIDRPVLEELRASARAGATRKIYVYRVDRLARSGIRDTLEVVQELRRVGCQIVNVADGFDLSSPASEIILAVLAWAAQMEREAIGSRIAAGIARAKAEGRSWGRPSRMSPLERRKARALRGEGKTIRAIAMALRVPRTVVERALKEVAIDVPETASEPPRGFRRAGYPKPGSSQ